MFGSALLWSVKFFKDWAACCRDAKRVFGYDQLSQTVADYHAQTCRKHTTRFYGASVEEGGLVARQTYG